MTNNQPGINFSLIIPNYNGSELILDCLKSIYSAIKNCPRSKFELIIVDNGSTDDSCQLSQNFLDTNKSPNLTSKIHHLPSNQGFAPAINYGINHSQYDYVGLVNNDLTLEPNWFQKISSSISNNQNPKIVVFFGTILNKTGDKFESQGLQFFIRGKCLNISNNKKFLPSTIDHLPVRQAGLPSTKLIWGASAALVVYQKDTLQKVGSFDDDFFAYEEDVDLALRLHLLGYQTMYIPSAISYHLGGGTSHRMANFRSSMDAKNWIYIIIKNYSIKDFLTNFPAILTERFRNLSGLVKNTIKIFKIKSIWILPRDILKTYGQVIFNLPKMLKKRRQIQKLLKSTKSI